MQNNCIEDDWEVSYEKEQEEEEEHWEKSVWRISPMKVVINTDKNIWHDEVDEALTPQSFLMSYKQSEMDKLKVLQQKLVEESDNALTKDLFNVEDPKIAQTLLKRPSNPVGLLLNTKDQYSLFAEECSKKLKTGTSLHLYEFYKTLLLNLSGVLSNEHTKLLVKQLESTIIRDVAVPKTQIFKKDIEVSKKRHQEVFGEAAEDEYEFYIAKYESF